jgi:hypothetical protein
VTKQELVRELRDLRRMERRVLGLAPDDPTRVWSEYFATESGTRVRYPLAMMLAFDRPSRCRAIREFMLDLWVRSGGSHAAPADARLRELLGLSPASSPDEVRAAFRRLALEIHPDLGGDTDLMAELIERYRQSSYGRSDSAERGS